MLPAEAELSRLARRVVDRERRYRRPVDTVRIEAWRIDYAPGTLAATTRLLREFVYRVDAAAAPRPDEGGVPDAVLTLTAIILLLRPFEIWWIAPFVLAAACLSLVFRAVRRAPLTWLLVSVLVAARIVVVWPLSDNHIYLLAYWCLAIGLALSDSAPAATLRRAADGCSAPRSRWRWCGRRCCRRTTSTAASSGSRCSPMSGLPTPRWCLAGSRTSRWCRTERSWSRFRKGPQLLNPPAFVEPPRLRAFAALATWGGLLLEALIALLCLIPAGGRIELARHAALLAFCVTTYALAPVAGFGWLIATMGLAQCRVRTSARCAAPTSGCLC